MVEEVGRPKAVWSSAARTLVRPPNTSPARADRPRAGTRLIVGRRLDGLLPSGWRERVSRSARRGRTTRGCATCSARARHRRRAPSGTTTGCGPDRPVARGAAARAVLVLVSDESDHGVQPRAFEHLLGLPEQRLRATPALPSPWSGSKLCPGEPRGEAHLDRQPPTEQPAPRARRMRAVPIGTTRRPSRPCPGGPPRARGAQRRAGPPCARSATVLGDPTCSATSATRPRPAADPPTTMPVGSRRRDGEGVRRHAQADAPAAELRHDPRLRRRAPEVEQVSSRDLLREVAVFQAVGSAGSADDLNRRRCPRRVLPLPVLRPATAIRSPPPAPRRPGRTACSVGRAPGSVGRAGPPSRIPGRQAGRCGVHGAGCCARSRRRTPRRGGSEDFRAPRRPRASDRRRPRSRPRPHC